MEEWGQSQECGEAVEGGCEHESSNVGGSPGCEQLFGQVHPGDVIMMERDQQHEPCDAGVGSEPLSLSQETGGPSNNCASPIPSLLDVVNCEPWASRCDLGGLDSSQGADVNHASSYVQEVHRGGMALLAGYNAPFRAMQDVSTHNVQPFQASNFTQESSLHLPWQPEANLDSPPQWCFFGPPSAWVPCQNPHDGPCNASCRQFERDNSYWSEAIPPQYRGQQRSIGMSSGCFPLGLGGEVWDESDGMSSMSSATSSSSQWCIQEQCSEGNSSKGIFKTRCRRTKEEGCVELRDHQWSDMMDEILCMVFKQLALEDAKRCRLVCRGWRDSVDQSISDLKLSWLKSRDFIKRFSFLTKLDLARCPCIRNRDLIIVTETVNRLRHLELGSNLTFPRISAKSLEHLSSLTSLTVLNLNECRSITNVGLEALTSLSKLHSLSLRGCISINSKELFIFGEEVTDAGIAELCPLTNLERLTLRETFNLEGMGVEELVRKVKGIRHLDLCNSEIDDEQFIAATYDWCKLESLDLRGCFVSDSALHEATHLTALKSLSIEPFWDLPIPPQMNFMLSSFTSLTHLGLVGDSVTVDVIAAVSTLPKLVELSIADHVFSENLLSRQPLNDGVVAGLASLTKLTSLDVSRQWLTKDQICLLAGGLQDLRELCIFDCRITDAELEVLQCQYPQITFHKHIMKDGVLHVKNAPGDIWAGQPNFF